MGKQVWITLHNGVHVFKDDALLPPCNKCGQRISVCRDNAKCESK